MNIFGYSVKYKEDLYKQRYEFRFKYYKKITGDDRRRYGRCPNGT